MSEATNPRDSANNDGLPSTSGQLTNSQQSSLFPDPKNSQMAPNNPRTQYVDRDKERRQQNQAMLDEFIWRTQIQQQQVQQPEMPAMQPLSAMMPPNAQSVQSYFPHDSGYGSSSLEDANQGFGLPGQRSQGDLMKTGHRYGKITASGNARIIRGNVLDPTRPNVLVRQHMYGDDQYPESARIFDGDATAEDMRGFWDRDL